MKHILIIILALLTMGTYGQSDVQSLVNKRHRYSMKDTIPIVTYLKPNPQSTDAAIILNGKLINETALYGLDPQRIESMKVLRDSFEIDNKKKYYGQLHIKTNKGYEPSFISLKDLVFKHTNLKKEPGIILFNDKIIFDKFSERLVDEKYILKIYVQEINNDENDIHFNLVKLITRTEENVNEANQIILRGNNEIQ